MSYGSVMVPADSARPSAIRRKRAAVREALICYEAARSAFIGARDRRPAHGRDGYGPWLRDDFRRALEARRDWQEEASRLARAQRIRSGIADGTLNSLGREKR